MTSKTNMALFAVLVIIAIAVRLRDSLFNLPVILTAFGLFTGFAVYLFRKRDK